MHPPFSIASVTGAIASVLFIYGTLLSLAIETGFFFGLPLLLFLAYPFHCLLQVIAPGLHPAWLPLGLVLWGAVTKIIMERADEARHTHSCKEKCVCCGCRR